MARQRIDYGIDLGTTNSAICRMENGEPVIKKTDVLKDTMPSCVYVNKKKAIQVGDRAYNALKKDKAMSMRGMSSSASNSFIEFKRTMGTDKQYHCTNLDRMFSSEELSGEVLKSLKSFVSDESFSSIVITVPAMFTINQKDATVRAALEHAGFAHCELLQEPIAASMAYGLNAESKNGHWLVFDFGGGTFDVALVRIEEGIMKVIDTEGDNYLGGKNIDYAIVDEILMPYLESNFSISSILSDDIKKKILREAVKPYAESAKIEMSFNDSANILSDIGDLPGEDDDGEEFELDINLTQTELEKTLAPIYQKAIDICLELLSRNNLTNDKLDSLILVGGPTYSPILRKMLEQQIIKPDMSVDPMTVVAKGAALFASTVEIPEALAEQEKDSTKIQIDLGYESTTVEEEEFVTIKLNTNNDHDLNTVFIDLARNDGAWSSGKVEVDKTGEVIEVVLNLGKPNGFAVKAYDAQGNLLPCEPETFTIIQGAKIGTATLPYHIGIEIKDRSTGKVVFDPVKGLEKNQPTPAVGTTNGLKTQKPMRPGLSEDQIKIAIYQGDNEARGSKAILNEHVYDAIITGQDIPKFLPEGSEVDLTLKVDKSERISLSVYIPQLDFTKDIDVPSNTTQKEIDATWLDNEINKAVQSINMMRHDGATIDSNTLDNLESDIQETKSRLDEDRSDYDRKKDVLDSLRKSLKKLDKLQEDDEWPKIEEEMKEVFYRLEDTHEKFGDEKSRDLISQYKSQIPNLIKEQNVKVAQDLIDSMRQLDFILMDQGLGAQMEIMYLKNFYEDFEDLDWIDANKAQMILNRGLQIAAKNPDKEQLREVVVELFKLLPDADKAIVSGGDGSELIG